MSLRTRGRKIVMGLAIAAAALGTPLSLYAACVTVRTTTTYKVLGFTVYESTETSTVCSS